jgi:hypothetical protein
MTCTCTGEFANINATLNTLQNDFNNLTGNILYNYNQLTRISSQQSNIFGTLTNGNANIVTGNLIITNFTNISKNLFINNGNINVNKDIFLSNVLTLGTDNGLFGESLRSSGASVLPVWNTPIIVRTTQTLTGTSQAEFTGIPSWVNQITMVINGASTVDGGDPIVRVGTSAGYVTSGYLGATRGNNGAATQSYITGIRLWNSTTWDITGILYTTLVLYHMGSNIWIFELTSSRSDNTYAATGSGSITLPGILDRIVFFTGTGALPNAFDAGSVNIQYN